MTEQEWSECLDPHRLLERLRVLNRLSDRGWRLFAVACCRHLGRLLTDLRSIRAIQVAERFADGSSTAEELDSAYDTAFAAVTAWDFVGGIPEPRGYAAYAAWLAAHPDESADDVAHYCREALDSEPELGVQVALLRDIFGNPFRPVVAEPAWLTSTVVALARGIYIERAFDRMPILADALQDAGCDHDDVLTHCRDPQQIYVRGCWVVDLALGKT